jgi:arylsulfatase A-like enzyme
MRGLRLALSVLVLAWWIPVPGSGQSTGGTPNVVLIVTDDLGWGDLTSYGAPDVNTPNIDAIGAAGIRLTDFYANGVLCSPTRAGLITGRYQHRYGLLTALGGASTTRGLVVTGNSLPQLMKDAGYATALVGKWHLGAIPEHSPNAHGFDHFFGFKAGYVDYYMHDRGPDQMDLWENGTPVEVEGYMTDLITERSIGFIEDNAGQPFFIDVAFNAPHWPYQRPDDPSRSRNNAGHLQPFSDDTNTRADYISMVERVDQGVGEILATLDRLNLTDNTLVIFTNDNGGEWLANSGPFFHRKWTVWEGGIRVPTLLRWPGHIPAGRASDQVGITMDLTATILTAAGAVVPADAEGIDLMPILSGAVPETERTLFWRTGAGGHNQAAVRSGDWKLVKDGRATLVFNLRDDPGERNDLAKFRQDVAHRLHNLLTAWSADVDAEALGRGLGPAG